jgi:hypothetical protein
MRAGGAYAHSTLMLATIAKEEEKRKDGPPHSSGILPRVINSVGAADFLSWTGLTSRNARMEASRRSYLHGLSELAPDAPKGKAARSNEQRRIRCDDQLSGIVFIVPRFSIAVISGCTLAARTLLPLYLN